MKNLLFKTIVLICFVTFSGFNQKPEKYVLQCDDFFKGVYEDGKGYLFDLRLKNEYIKSRLVDAVLVDTKAKFTAYLKNIDKDARIFIYCEEGYRTKEGAKWLNTLGYKNVYQLKGGFNYWKKQGYPIDSEKIK